MKAKHYWYSNVKKQIQAKEWQSPQTFQDYIMLNAIYTAYNETLELANGEARAKAISKLLIEQSETYESYAIKNYYSVPTIKRWICAFIDLVGRKAGY